jgi:acyl-CoA synthetase (AMP-forming)/AMP-acid ligase II
MNAAELIRPHIEAAPHRLALWTGNDGVVSYAEFGELAARAQAVADHEGLRPGEPVLLLARPSATLFATIVGLMAAGIPVMFVEPWLPIADIEHVVRAARPQAFWTGMPGRFWGLRVAAVRGIPRWISLGRVARDRARGPMRVVDVRGATPAMLAFTSGTTGRPKGIVRTHAYVRAAHDVLAQHIDRGSSDGPDLSIFPSFALLNLARGRGAVVAPPDWDTRALRRIAALPRALQPRTLTCGPAFLAHLIALTDRGVRLPGLESIGVGGALTDCAVLERGFAEWPGASWTHLYGSTEVEPVAVADARAAVAASRERGLHQTLSCGTEIPELECEQSSDGLWVTGPSVAVPLAPLGAAARCGRVDARGRYWHCTGDRVTRDREGLWFAGRATQPENEFALEQQIYARLQSSACFVHRDTRGALWLYGERLDTRRGGFAAVRRDFPQLAGVRHARIVRDRRHRSRIDRARTLESAGHGRDA